MDAIQEFSMPTADYAAEYGRTSGGVFNAITKPGTNDFQGKAYWFLRNEGLDATSFCGPQISPFHRNQFGGSVGGPIQKDKTSVLGDFELIRQVQGLKRVQLVVPSPAARGIGPSGQPRVAIVKGSHFRPAVLMQLRIRTQRHTEVHRSWRILRFSRCPICPIPSTAIQGCSSLRPYTSSLRTTRRQGSSMAQATMTYSNG